MRPTKILIIARRMRTCTQKTSCLISLAPLEVRTDLNKSQKSATRQGKTRKRIFRVKQANQKKSPTKKHNKILPFLRTSKFIFPPPIFPFHRIPNTLLHPPTSPFPFIPFQPFIPMIFLSFPIFFFSPTM